MHIPDGFLSPTVWGTLDVVSGSCVALGLRQVAQELEEKSIPLMGVLAAFVFAAQMINLPIAGGTSAHFLGGSLVAILLGPWAGLTVMTVVLVVQCFLFQDGGVAALGANIFNMGFIGSLISGTLYLLISNRLPVKRRIFWSGFIVGWSTIVLSAACCAAELALSHVISWGLALSIIVGVHAVIGLLEGIVTGTILESVAAIRPDLFYHPSRKSGVSG